VHMVDDAEEVHEDDQPHPEMHQEVRPPDDDDVGMDSTVARYGEGERSFSNPLADSPAADDGSSDPFESSDNETQKRSNSPTFEDDRDGPNISSFEDSGDEANSSSFEADGGGRSSSSNKPGQAVATVAATGTSAAKSIVNMAKKGTTASSSRMPTISEAEPAAAPANGVSARSFWQKQDAKSTLGQHFAASGMTTDENGDGHHSVHDNSLRHLDASFHHDAYSDFVQAGRNAKQDDR
jgi:hypothetical protein